MKFNFGLVTILILLWLAGCSSDRRRSDEDGGDSDSTLASDSSSETDHTSTDPADTGFVPTNLTFLRSSGHDVVDEDGNKILFRGVNLGGWLHLEGYIWHVFDNAGHTKYRLMEEKVGSVLGDEAERFWEEYRENFITQADMDAIKAGGMNVVRLPMNARKMMDEGTGALIEDGFRDVQRAINMAKAADIYVILDLHAAPGGQTGASDIDDSPSPYNCPKLYTNKLHQDRLTTLWRAIAERWASEPAVAGYDLLNEPIAWKDQLSDECGASDWKTDYIDRYVAKLWPLYTRLKNEIRQVDTNHMIIVEGYGFGSEFEEGALDMPFDDNMMYSFHYYGDLGGFKNRLNKYIQARVEWKRPIFVGEFGENEGKDAYIDSIITSCEANNMGWTMWTWKRMNSQGRTPLEFERHDNWGQMEKFFLGDSPPDNAASLLWDMVENVKYERCNKNRSLLDVLNR